MTREIIKNAKSAVKGHWWQIFLTMNLFVYVTAFAIYGLDKIFNLIGLTTSSENGITLGYVLYELISIILLSFLTVGYGKYLVDKYHGNGHFYEIFSGFKEIKKSLYVLLDLFIVEAYVFVVSFVTVIVASIIPILGVLLALAIWIYAIYWIIRGAYFIYAILEGCGPIDAFKRSFKITKKHVWQAIWMGIRLMLIPIILLSISVIIFIVAGFASGILVGYAAGAEAGIAAGTIIGTLCVSVIFMTAYIWLLILTPASQFLNIAYYEEHSGERLNMGLTKLDGDGEVVEVEFKEIIEEEKDKPKEEPKEETNEDENK